MFFKSENALKTIADGLAWLEASCRHRGLLHLLDNHVLSQRFFCRLLNALYGINLEVMDRIQSNYPAIDLGDAENRIAFQVSTEKAGGKVQHTLDKFVEYDLQARFDRLRVLVIGQRQDRYTALSIPKEITFDPETDILDHGSLLKAVDALPTSSLQELARIFEEEVTHVGQHSTPLFRIEIHHKPDEVIHTHEIINVEHCERYGRPVVPTWLTTTPERMCSPWLVERLLNNSELQLYFDPKWCGGTSFVADVRCRDGVVLNPAQFADLKPPSPTTTTTPAPKQSPE